MPAAGRPEARHQLHTIARKPALHQTFKLSDSNSFDENDEAVGCRRGHRPRLHVTATLNKVGAPTLALRSARVSVPLLTQRGQYVLHWRTRRRMIGSAGRQRCRVSWT